MVAYASTNASLFAKSSDIACSFSLSAPNLTTALSIISACVIFFLFIRSLVSSIVYLINPSCEVSLPELGFFNLVALMGSLEGLSSGLMVSDSNLFRYSLVDLGAGLFLKLFGVSSGSKVSKSLAPVKLLCPLSCISFKFLTAFLLNIAFVNLNEPAENAAPNTVPNPKPAAVAIAPLPFSYLSWTPD